MPSPSKRKTAMTNIVTLLKTIVAGGTYYRTLNIGDNVSTKVRFQQSVQEGDSFIWVRPGSEDLRQADINPGGRVDARFEIILDIWVKDATGESMVDELENLVHDISLCLGDDRTLSGAVDDAFLERIDQPIYGIEEFTASTSLHVFCAYEFDYGTSI